MVTVNLFLYCQKIKQPLFELYELIYTSNHFHDEYAYMTQSSWLFL